MATISELEKISTQVRRDVLRMIHAVKSGHPGGALGCADFFTVLYNEILIHHPKNFTMEGKNEDIFFFGSVLPILSTPFMQHFKPSGSIPWKIYGLR